MHSQYRTYAPQVPQRSPHNTPQRRGGIGPMMSSGPHPQVPLTQAQIAQQQQAQAQANELARRRSRKPTDKNIPDGVENVIVGAEGVQRYREMRDVEKRLDSIITRKRLDVTDNVNRTTKVSRTLRIWISNTVEDQAWQGGGLNVDAFDFTPNMEASYRVKIEGRLLDDEDDQRPEIALEPRSDEYYKNGEASFSEQLSAQSSEQRPKQASRPTFSQFFKAIVVESDRPRFQNGDEQIVEWKKSDTQMRAPSSAQADEFDDFTFKRSGDENMNITIQLYRQEAPERYRLSPELASVVDMTEATQQEAVMCLWEYIRFMGLQEDEEKRNFRCNEPLRRIVRRGDVGYIPMLNEYVTQHLQPLPPLTLPYTIRVDEEFHQDPKPTVYDIQVSVDDPIRGALLPLINNPNYASMLKEVNGLDEQLARLVQAVSVSKAKHAFFVALADDPANFIRNWLSSQKRDLEVITGEASKGGIGTVTGDDWRRGGKDSVWGTQNARESVNVLLSKHH